MDSQDNSSRNRGQVTMKIWVHAGLMVLFLVLGLIAWQLYLESRLPAPNQFLDQPANVRFTFLLSVAFIAAAAYQLIALGIQVAIKQRGGSPGEVTMLTGFVRIIALFAIIVLLLGLSGTLERLQAVVGAAFLGAMLGWGLQAPVSGMAAWAMIAMKRPFRIGDRVLFPSLSLLGDVLEVGLMYTKLNQVGGSIGSEEAIGRHILIPNAMLFSQVAINYTPQLQAPYFLDEVIIRLTYDSDWDAAEKILLNAALEVTGPIIQETQKEPYVRCDVYDYGVYMRLRFMTPAWDRPRIAHEILKRIFHEFQNNPRVDFAIPYIYSNRKGVESGGRAAPIGDSVSEVGIENIDDPDANVPLRPADPNYIAELADRIKQMGLLQPILVQRMPTGRFMLVAGRFKLLACQRLGWKTIPVTIKEGDGARVEPEHPGR